MGYDVSLHPVDEAFLREVLTPYIAGQRELPEDLLRRGAQIAKNRFHANAWGLGVAHEHGRRFEEVPKPRGVLRRLFGGGAPPELPPEPFPLETDLYVWGRPFFITDDQPAEVSKSIDQYLAASDREVGDIARAMVRRVAPSHATVIEPSYDDGVPTDEQFARSFIWKMELFRDAFSAIRSGGMVNDPDGNEHDPVELFATDFPLSAISFMAQFRPGWMDRGYVWPSKLFADAGLDLSWFETAQPLFEPLCLLEPKIQLPLTSTIEENYTLGGYVPSSRVTAFRDYFNQQEQKIVKQAAVDGWGEGAALTLRKLREAISDAASRGMGFLEASEVYSGPLGIMN
jgi:hypothetical protein